MQTPLISVIIPAYNLETCLESALDSVLAQSYANLEIIVVNDGSIDQTGAIIDCYAAKDSRIKAVHKENGGVTSARLRGVEEATGEWIGFVDGDDYIEPQMYERLMANAVKYEADISHCGYQMVFPSRTDYYHNTGKVILQDHVTGLKHLLEGNLVEPGIWNKLFRHSLFLGLEEHMDLSIKINEDLLMNYWLFKAANTAVFEDFCPYHYLVRKGSAANSCLNEHWLRDPLKVTHMIMDQADNSLQPVLLRRLTRQLITGATMELSGQPELVKPFRAETRQELRRRLGEILRSECGISMKTMAFWAAVWPASYGWVHKTYSKLRGLDKKYEIS